MARDTMAKGACCLLEETKISAPHLAFSDTTLARGQGRCASSLSGGDTGLRSHLAFADKVRWQMGQFIYLVQCSWTSMFII